MEKFGGLANTLFVPLVARINVSKKFPEYFMDSKALELESYLPAGVDKGSSEYSNMASVARYYNMDKMVTAFAEKHTSCNVVYLGAGFETAYDRLNNKLNNRNVNWYEIDLPSVIDARRTIFGHRENETLISGDMFGMEWVKEIDSGIPSLFIASGVFHYFHDEKVIDFIKSCTNAFPNSELIFDATSKSGLIVSNYFIRRTGNVDALMYFGVNDGKYFAEKCGMELIDEKTFFTDALRILGKKLGFVTRLFMKVAELKKQLLILHMGARERDMTILHEDYDVRKQMYSTL
jgi:O-methyltransferase involved in polyketide biosynthesis